MSIAGVDDAGRGSIIGPLAIAGVLFDEDDLRSLPRLGVRDSKCLSVQKRVHLATEIKRLALTYHVELLSPSQIDKVVESGRKLHKLNRLEAQTMGDVISRLKPTVAYVDAADVLPDRFKRHVAETIPFDVKIVSEHKADLRYPVVSAASILAKVERDSMITQLQEKYGNIGCGYPTDRNTLRFLENWIKDFGSYPDFVRKSWKPAKRIKRQMQTGIQKRIV